uniref:Global nitrogen transcriptional regulator n=1 Tax=Rhodymenia pseudopalmata TaxID=31502 RepID=A0A1C9C7S4_RHOPU|nr:global nitrogen transcriptional regulator [Rhodymenia pseudopalmata]AOM64429.1 global nitrogen transcriptional regulator [Rhodymenia pseudopalmata]
MQWIYYFMAHRIPFYVYKIPKNDCFIYTEDNQLNKTAIVLHGSLLMIKIFTNQEQLCLAILRANSIIDIKKNNAKIKVHYYYKVIALDEVWLMTFKSNEAFINSPIIIKSLTASYNITLLHYEMMNNILTHKEAKNRILQLLVYLAEQFGYTKNNYTIIKFRITQSNIALIIGTNKITVNKILKMLKKDALIKYSKNKIMQIYSHAILKKIISK